MKPVSVPESSDEEGKDSQFVIRMEAAERKRREDRKHKQGKREHDARLDKKSCPVCGAEQAYDEYLERRKKCLNCNVEYRSKTSWAKVGRSFLERQETDLLAREEKRRELVEMAEKAEAAQMTEGKRQSAHFGVSSHGDAFLSEGPEDTVRSSQKRKDPRCGKPESA
eukprot:scaffold260_cov274-Pinguiococcus_pyrenoidosus.AAC.2